MAQSPVLLALDLQNDFVPGGACPAPGGELIVPTVNRAVDAIFGRGVIIYTRDWHPPDHCSFKFRGGSMPQHCIRGTVGAAFLSYLKVLGHVFHKGMDPDVDERSATCSLDSPLSRFIHGLGPSAVYVCGLATEHCVMSHVMDLVAMGTKSGWDVYVLTDAIAAVNAVAGDGDRALESMRIAGARFLTTSALEALSFSPPVAVAEKTGG